MELLSVWILHACLWCSALASSVAHDAKGEVYTSALYGFRVQAPGADWKLQSAREPGSGALTVSIASSKVESGLVVSVRALVLLEASTPESARQLDLDFMKGKALYGEPRLFDVRLAGVQAKALDVVYHAPQGSDHLVRKLHLVGDDVHYAIEAYAPAKEFSACEKDLQRILDSFAFVDAGKGDREKRRMEALSAKCGSEIDWAEGWEQASDRARREKKPVLVSANFLQSFALADQAQAVTFMDPDLVALANARFVCLRVRSGTEAPFRSQQSYGMGKHAFGVALLVVSAEGEVLDQDECLYPEAVDAFLRASLARHREYANQETSRDESALARAQALARAGEIERALATIENESSSGAHLLRARCRRRLGDGVAALAAIDLAAKARDAGELAQEIGIERGLILLRTGKTSEALDSFEGVLATSASFTAAQYWRGECSLILGKTEAARGAWLKLAREHPEDRWAWAAAAALASPMLAMQVTWNPRFIEPAKLRSLRDDEAQAMTIDRARDARDGARAFLLREQRADGSWTSPSEIRTYETPRPDPFVDAITALAGEALLGSPANSASRAAA